jgi:hypothetical protein
MFFKLIVIFPPMTSIRKTYCPLQQKGVKRTRKAVTLETKMLVIRRMDAGKTRANVCSALGVAPAAVSPIIANAEKIK